MSSRTRSYIQNGPMWRGVNLHEQGGRDASGNWVPTGVYRMTYTGPYDTPGKAKASVHTKGSWIEMAEPVWEKVEGWERTR